MTRLSIGIVAAVLATACVAPVARTDLQQSTGRLRLLAAGESPVEYDGSRHQRPSHVIVELDTEFGKTFELQLRSGRDELVRRGMFDLLRDAQLNGRTVVIDYSTDGGGNRHVIRKVALLTEPSPATVRVTEVPQQLSATDDPIVTGGRLDPVAVLAQLPVTPPEFKGTGAHELMASTKVTILEEAPLGAGERREASVFFDEPVLLQARADWFGAVVPVELTVSAGGEALATGKVYPAPPNRGTATIDVRIQAPGTANVSVRNPGPDVVHLRMVVGVLPLSVAKARVR